jgi:hypothetical protein
LFQYRIVVTTGEVEYINVGTETLDEATYQLRFRVDSEVGGIRLAGVTLFVKLSEFPGRRKPVG